MSKMIRSYSRIILCMQVLILPTSIFLWGVVEKAQNVTSEKRKRPHNQFYLNAFSINIVRLADLSLGIAIATIVLVFVMRKDFRESSWMEKSVFLGGALVPVIIGVLGRNQV